MIVKKYYPLSAKDLTDDDVHINEIYSGKDLYFHELEEYISRTNVIVKDALTRMMQCPNPY